MIHWVVLGNTFNTPSILCPAVIAFILIGGSAGAVWWHVVLLDSKLELGGVGLALECAAAFHRGIIRKLQVSFTGGSVT